MQLTLKPLLLDQIQFEKRPYCEAKRSVEFLSYLGEKYSAQHETLQKPSLYTLPIVNNVIADWSCI